MTHKRTFAALVAVGLVSLGLAGCGKSEPLRRPSSTKPPVTTDNTPPATTSGEAPPAETPIAEGWGDLTGRFVYQGAPFEPMKVTVTKDVEVCSKHNPVDETLLVASDGGLANVVLFVRDKNIKISPEYEAEEGKEVAIDNLHCRFDPHVVVLWTKQKLVIKNSDPIGHNTKADFFTNNSFNVLLQPEKSVESPAPIDKEERVPAKIGCNIHPWMGGYLVVRDNPYATVTAADGTFTIKNLPSGKHEFQLWHEKVGNLTEIEVQGQPVKKGRVTLTIQPGANDLGAIPVPEFK